MSGHPYRVPARRPEAPRRRRVAGRIAIGCFVACAIGTAVAGVLATRSAPSVAQAAAPPVPLITDLPDDEPEVLYESTWPTNHVVLIGIDPARKQAVLQLEARGEPGRLAFDTIDYARRERIERWEASPSNMPARSAYPPEFHPLTSDFSSDLARLAKLVRFAPDAALPFGLDPMMAVDRAGGAIVYDQTPKDGHDGDNLFLTDGAGKHVRRIDEGLTASYDPVFSPDGARVATRACGRPCDYFLYVTDVRGAHPPVRTAVSHPRTHAWSADGKSVYVLARPTDHDAELFRVSVDAPSKPVRLFADRVEQAELYVSPDRGHAVVAGRDRFVFFDLRTEQITRDAPLDAGSLASLGPGGVLLSADRAGVLAYDPRTEKHGSFRGAGWYLQPFYAAWESPDAAIAVRTAGDRLQLVRLDVARRLRL